jgi:hypothetical protein
MPGDGGKVEKYSGLLIRGSEEEREIDELEDRGCRDERLDAGVDVPHGGYYRREHDDRGADGDGGRRSGSSSRARRRVHSACRKAELSASANAAPDMVRGD